MTRRYAPAETIAVITSLIGNLAHQLNRANGYLDRLDWSISDGVLIPKNSIDADRLEREAKSLRALADAMDERRLALVGVAPRFKLVAGSK